MAQAFDKTTHGVDGPQVGNVNNVPATLPYSGDWVKGDEVQIGSRWGAVGTPVAPIKFRNHFNLDIESIDCEWVIGYLNENTTTGFPYTTELDDIEVDTPTKVSKLQDSFTELPLANAGVIGYTDTSAGTQGYYGGMNFEIYRLVAITDGSDLFVIKVLIQDVLQLPNGKPPMDPDARWKSSLIFEVKFFEGLSIPVTTCSSANNKEFIDSLIKKVTAKK